MSSSNSGSASGVPGNTPSRMDRFLDAIERTGNRLPDPAMLFIYGLGIVLVLSVIFSMIHFNYINSRTGEPLQVANLMEAGYLVELFAAMVTTFTSFAPLGMVLAAVMGVGIAESSGYINIALKKMVRHTPEHMLAPAVVFIGAVSSIATDAGYVLVIPIGAIIFQAADRHPLAGLAAAFAGVSM